MKKSLACISLLAAILAFFPTAYADVPDPYGRHRPHIQPPGIQTRLIRAISFHVANGKSDNSFILKVTLPGTCDWHFTVYDNDKKEQFVSDIFSNEDFNKETDEKEFVLSLPENAEGLEYEIKADFTMYTYTETRYGPKLYNKKGNRYGQRKMFVLKWEDGRYALVKR